MDTKKRNHDSVLSIVASTITIFGFLTGVYGVRQLIPAKGDQIAPTGSATWFDGRIPPALSALVFVFTLLLTYGVFFFAVAKAYRLLMSKGALSPHNTLAPEDVFSSIFFFLLSWVLGLLIAAIFFPSAVEWFFNPDGLSKNGGQIYAWTLLSVPLVFLIGGARNVASRARFYVDDEA
jgi:hypothetical protein